MSIWLRFWGVRGSIPAPGPDTARTGANTPCVEVTCEEDVVILDGGSGLRRLGNDLLDRQRRGVQATLLFSHVHWDHIQGLPFFAPLYQETSSLVLRGAGSLEDALRQQMRPPNFPVSLADVPASIRFEPVIVGSRFEVGRFAVTSAPLHHPAGCAAFRLDALGRSIVYATDTEPRGVEELDGGLVELARGADVLIHDAQYTEAEYRGVDGTPRRGWGHSTWQDAVRVARAAKVDRLILFHHDPARDDEAVEQLEREARVEWRKTTAAHEGLEIQLQSCVRRRAA